MEADTGDRSEENFLVGKDSLTLTLLLLGYSIWYATNQNQTSKSLK